MIGLDWRIPLDERLGGGRRGTAASRATSTRAAARAVGAGRGGGARRPRACRRAAGHIFNLGHGVLPQTDPDVLKRLTELVQERTVGRRAMSAGGRPDGVRLARAARGRPRLLRGHPRRAADRARVLDDLVARYRRSASRRPPLNAITEQTRAALERELALPAYTGMRHWRRGSRTRPSSARRRRMTLVGLVLAPHWSSCRSPVRSAVRGGGRRPCRLALRRELARLSGVRRPPRRAHPGDRRARGVYGAFPA